MKMTRQVLKEIVKECLVEILSEGLTGTQRSINESRSQTQTPQMPTAQAQSVRRQTIADKISFLPKKEEIRAAPRHQSDVSQNLAKSLTADPVLADIFADTARSGMHNQMNESSSRVDHEQMIASAGDAAARAMLRSDPSDVFGDSAGKWAALAFSEKIPKRS